MKSEQSFERKTFICSCNSLEHQLSFWYDDEYNELYTEVHLYTYKNIFKRIISAIKYVFGYKSKYGDWDSIIFKNDDVEKLKNYLNNLNNDKTNISNRNTKSY